ncbi:MAG: ribonuclease D [Fibrobacterota bacterium]
MNSYIETDEELKQVCTVLKKSSWLAVDTEFMWTRTYFPILALIQVCGDAGACIIDYPALNDLSPLADIFEDSSIVKVFHDAGQDVSILNHNLNITMHSVFDTQRAAAMDGQRESLSLEKLVRIYTGVSLSKSQTRTDWLRRPLNPSQIEYALDDVRYLVGIAKTILHHAESRGSRAWIMEEMKLYEDYNIFCYEDTLKRQFLKNASRVSAKYRENLYRLIAFVEQEARSRDVSRQRILSRDVLPSLAKGKFSDAAGLSKRSRLSPKKIKQYGEAIIAALNNSDETIPPEFSASVKPSGDRGNRTLWLTTLLNMVIYSVCRTYAVDYSVVCSRSTCADMVARYMAEGVLPSFDGWRGEMLNAYISDFFAGNLSLKYDEKNIVNLVDLNEE